MGRPLDALLDKPKPKITWNQSRGVLSTAAQTVVRPVSSVSCCVFCPRASQVVRTLENAMTATDTVMPAPANNLRTRALAANMLRPATRRPAIKAITSVLV